jgi:hypothetical protein
MNTWQQTGLLTTGHKHDIWRCSLYYLVKSRDQPYSDIKVHAVLWDTILGSTRTVVGFCEHGNEMWYFIKDEKFID